MRSMEQNKTCCVFGHRTLEISEELISDLYKTMENLIVNEKVDTFLFGSKSIFNTLCLKVVTELKEKYSYIKRIYVRSANQNIGDWYINYLLESYDDTYYPKRIENAGRATYVERNQEMINRSKFCVVYYNENYHPSKRRNSKRDLFEYQPKSGTSVAYAYAVTKKKVIINTFKKDISVGTQSGDAE